MHVMLLGQQAPGHIANAAKLIARIAAVRPALAASVSSSLTLHKSWFTSSASDQTDAAPHLSVQELHHAAKLARLSGLCYGTPETLAARLQAEGLQVIAQGQTSFTRWYVATGSLQQPLADLDKLASSTNKAKPAGKPATPDSNPDTESEDHESASADAAWQSYVQNEQSTRRLTTHNEHCVILMRGVVWRSDQVQVMNLWQNLLKFWPVPFASNLVKPKGGLQAHGGMAEMANELYEHLEPHIKKAKSAGQVVCFGGHSLGGALATLVCSLALLNSQLPSQQLQCVTFGSPSVLAHTDGKDGNAILQVLGLSSRHLRSFVLDSDPIPRALLSIDPTFSFIQGWSAVKGFMQIRQWFTGQPAEIPAVNPARLLYANVGEVYLIKWTINGGHKVQLLTLAEAEQQLKLAVGQLMTRPPAAMQALLDHSHDSYAKDLDSAARQLAWLKR